MDALSLLSYAQFFTVKFIYFNQIVNWQPFDLTGYVLSYMEFGAITIIIIIPDIQSQRLQIRVLLFTMHVQFFYVQRKR